MKTAYKILPALIISASLLIFTSPAYSRGSGGGSSGGHSGGKGTMSGGHGSGMRDKSGRGGYSGRDGGMQKSQRQRIRATKQQHNQIGACIQSANNIRTRVRDMQRNMRRSNFSIDQAAQERNRLRNEIRTMHEEHKRFMQSLGNEQQEQIKYRIRNMERERDHIDYHFQKMDEELNMAEPDRDQIAYQAKEMERAMEEWREQYRNVAK